MTTERFTFSATSEVAGRTVSGRAHTFGQRTLVGGKWIAFAKGAFDEALARATTDVRAFLGHDVTKLLGRQGNGTVRLAATPEGLDYAIDMPETSYANDALALMERGDLRDMSFGIIPGAVKLSRASDGKQVVTHTSVAELFDVSPVALPAYSGTSVVLNGRSGDTESPRSQAIRARRRVLKGETNANDR